MKFKTGDEVKFLNEKGGGIVASIISDKIVAVATDDGFEIPTAVKDLIKVGSGAMGREEEESGNFRSSYEEQSSDVSVSLQKHHTHEKAGEGLFIAFFPHEQNIPVTGMLDIEIINTTSFDFIYSIFLKTEGDAYKGTDYGTAEAKSSHYIAGIERGETDIWKSGIVQGLLHTDHPPFIPLPLNSSFSVKSTRFLKEDNYRYYDFSDRRCFLIKLADLSELKSSSKTLASDIHLKAVAVKSPSLISRHLNADKSSALVDLHIHVLSESSERLRPSEALNIQLAYFNNCLQSAIKDGVKKVVFIHGVGQGILKAEIRKTLSSYDFISFYDAPLAEYGSGATELRIYQSAE